MRRRTHQLRSANIFAILAILSFAGCSGLNLEDCPKDGVLGNNELGTARLRTSHYRIVLADTHAAAARVLPYALMSAYAYRLGPGCEDSGKAIRVPEDRAAELLKWLAQTTDESSKWNEQPTLGLPGGCEDNEGLMLQVWDRKVGRQTYVVIAFRGTTGGGDWVYGNLWWFTRWFYKDNQLTRARAHAERIMQHYENQASASGDNRPRFVATGHSLGGTLAQHVLYSFPDRVAQAIVFDPSSVTGFADVGRDNQVKGCSCEPESLQRAGVHLQPEARILHVYQTYEILSDLRFFHKLFFVPERHVQELRFPFPESINQIERHSMQTFASNLYAASGTQIRNNDTARWLASADSTCTKKVIDAQTQSCQRTVGPNDLSVCPQ
jgi:pimeloyl-ACP methyl ester carboxylesterase